VVVVLYRGQLIGEAYAPGFDASTPQLGWSMTKGITGTLVGILVRDGVLDLDQPVDLPQWQDDERRNITIGDLMRMSSGLTWNEGYGNLTDATRMLYLSPDMPAYTISKPLEAAPGTYWVYASGTTNLLSFIIRREMDSLEEYWAFPRKALFNRIGMRSAVLEPDASGTFVGSSYCFATPRDWARFGLLYLNDGVWQGERILPAGWVSYSRETAPASGGEYGAQFWLNRAGTLPDVPADTYACQGFQEQRIFIIPSRDLVVVRMGLTENDAFDFNRFLADVLQAIPEN
jgi:CubicO group peptidase (beta-lactamase class C family)